MNRIVPFKKKEFENSKGGYIEFLEVPLRCFRRIL
jgi:hypothetical protein